MNGRYCCSQGPTSHHHKLIRMVSTELFFSPVARSPVTVHMFIIYVSTSFILVLISSLVGSHFFSSLSSLRLFHFTNVLQIAPLIVFLTVQYSNHVAVLENSTRAASESSTCTLALSYASPRLTTRSTLLRSPSHLLPSLPVSRHRDFNVRSIFGR
jgi:hypothetical protein